MNKVEYLNALKESLKDTDESVLNEIVSDYEEHFQVGIENGKSEEQICEDLGAIEDLVKEIKEVYNTDNKDAKNENDNQTDSGKKSREWHFNIPNIDSEKIGNVINSALDTAGEAISKIDVVEIGHTIKNTLGQATSSINNFADNLKNHGAGPFDFNKRNAEGYKENVSKSYGSDEEDLSKKNVSYDTEPETNTSDYAQGDTDINTAKESSEAEDRASSTSASESSRNQAETRDTEDKTNFTDTTETERTNYDEALDPEDDRQAETFINEENFINQETEGKESEAEDVKKAKGELNLVIEGICADVTVQKSPNDKININYVNNGNDRQKQIYEFYSYKEGNTVYAGIRKVGKAVFLFNINSIHINVELPENLNYVNINTANGDIRVDNVMTDRIIVTTASGDVQMNGLYTTDLKIKSASGDISLQEVNSIQLKAVTMSGDIDANNINAKFLSLKSTSGDVKTKNMTAEIIDSSSLSGDLELVNIKASECKIRSTSGDIDINEFSMNNADVSSVSGDIKLINIIGDGLRVGSTSGDIGLDVTMKRCHASSRSGDVKVKSNGDIVLESSSTSGDINVILKNNGNGYFINSRTTSGDLYINYNNMRQRNLKTGTYNFGNQGSELTISSVSGDIHVND